MSEWRALKAARERRELKRATESLQRVRRDLNAARNERDNALRSPMLALKREALSYLAGRTADAILKASNENVRAALAEIQRTGMDRAEVSAENRWGDMSTVFRIEIPRSAYHFIEDVGRLARF